MQQVHLLSLLRVLELKGTRSLPTPGLCQLQSTPEPQASYRRTLLLQVQSHEASLALRILPLLRHSQRFPATPPLLEECHQASWWRRETTTSNWTCLSRWCASGWEERSRQDRGGRRALLTNGDRAEAGFGVDQNWTMVMGGEKAVEAGRFPEHRAYGMSAPCAEEGRKVEGPPQSCKVQPMTYILRSQKPQEVGGFTNLVVYWSHSLSKTISQVGDFGGRGNVGLC